LTQFISHVTTALGKRTLILLQASVQALRQKRSRLYPQTLLTTNSWSAYLQWSVMILKVIQG